MLDWLWLEEQLVAVEWLGRVAFEHLVHLLLQQQRMWHVLNFHLLLLLKQTQHLVLDSNVQQFLKAMEAAARCHSHGNLRSTSRHLPL